jgi:hypothetical protein
MCIAVMCGGVDVDDVGFAHQAEHGGRHGNLSRIRFTPWPLEFRVAQPALYGAQGSLATSA